MWQCAEYSHKRARLSNASEQPWPLDGCLIRVRGEEVQGNVANVYLDEIILVTASRVYTRN